jgi:hypothetical protein
VSLFDRYFPTQKRLGHYLNDMQKAADSLKEFHGGKWAHELELDSIFLGISQADMEATAEYDMEARGKEKALQKLDKALGRYKVLKKGCLARGRFREDDHEQEERLRYGLRKYARQLMLDANKHGLKNVLELAIHRNGNPNGTGAV